MMTMNNEAGAGNPHAPTSDSASIECARALTAALIEGGVHDVVYCPGSRSAPMAYALHEAVSAGQIRAHIRLDERSAAFLALGLSRGSTGPADAHELTTPTPVAIVTTSGGAVAELHAGVAEASHSRVPLIVISADRPFEMRGVGASQTTNQVGIFASHVRAHWDIPAGQRGHDVRSTLTRAIALACGYPTGEPGPVQINVAFRDPLGPPASARQPDPADDHAPQRPGPALVDWARSTTVVPAAPCATAWIGAVDPALRTIILAGEGADPVAPQWAEAAQIPLMGEPTSGVAGAANFLPFEQSLLSSSLADEVQQVVVTGRPTLSRTVSALLAREDLRIVVQCPYSTWTDVAGRAALVVAALEPAEAPHDEHFASPSGTAVPPVSWLQRWISECERIRVAMSGLLESGVPGAAHSARHVWNACGGGPLIVGASSIIRALDLVADGPGPRKAIANRGLAGIDGTVATAIGVALASGEATHALMGDLTFFHDAAALAIPADETIPDLRIIVVDDGGGSIFSTLEHGRATPEVYQRWFQTPQNISLLDLCSAYKVRYRQCEVGELPAVLAQRPRGIEVVHLRVAPDPELFVALRRAGQ